MSEEIGNALAETLRNEGFGTTIIEGKGKDHSEKILLFVQLKRKRIFKAIKIIKQTDPSAYISVNDVKSVVGGFIKK